MDPRTTVCDRKKGLLPHAIKSGGRVWLQGTLSHDRKWITIFVMSTNMSTVKILDLTPVQLKEYLVFLGEPVSAADRILNYIYRECAVDLRK